MSAPAISASSPSTAARDLDSGAGNRLARSGIAVRLDNDFFWTTTLLGLGWVCVASHVIRVRSIGEVVSDPGALVVAGLREGRLGERRCAQICRNQDCHDAGLPEHSPRPL